MSMGNGKGESGFYPKGNEIPLKCSDQSSLLGSGQWNELRKPTI